MVSVLSGLGAALASVLIHFVVVRLTPAAPRPMPVLAGTIIVAAGLGFYCGSLAAAVYAAALAGALMVAYLLLYIGVEHDSPTLALAAYINGQGDAGMPEGEIDTFIDSYPFTQARIDKLLDQGIVALEGGRYRMRGLAGLFVGLTQLYRRLAGMDKASG